MCVCKNVFFREHCEEKQNEVNECFKLIVLILLLMWNKCVYVYVYIKKMVQCFLQEHAEFFRPGNGAGGGGAAAAAGKAAGEAGGAGAGAGLGGGKGKGRSPKK